MKNLLFFVLFASLIGYLFVVLVKGREDSVPETAEVSAEAETIEYPAALTVTNLEGRELEVTLVARDDSQIQFQRAGDAEYYFYPIAELSEASREVVRQYPISEMLEVEDDAGSTEPEGIDALYVAQLKEGIARIDEKIAEMRRRGSASSSGTERRTLQRQIEVLNREKIDLENKIAERE